MVSSRTKTLPQRRLFAQLKRLAAKEPPRIYVSADDHRTLYLYFDATWNVAPQRSRRDQLRINGIPIVWRSAYQGIPTLTDPCPEEGGF